ncbi:HalOD1 output domain-containing protein [Haladaptatus sp. CMAA 1911]|uniref:HalOD1 output domain-containing protein n=1 Tax=unclassified Haladaptatus TaxID=2622732 RepID=UPI003754FDD0
MTEKSDTGPGSGDAFVYRQLTPTKEDVQVDIAEVVAELKGVRIEDLTPVYSAVDHLIETLFSPELPPEAQAIIDFTYEEYRIEINQDGVGMFMRMNPHK